MVSVQSELKKACEDMFSDMLQAEKYAGTACCAQDETEMARWQGYYQALKQARIRIQHRIYEIERAQDEEV